MAISIRDAVKNVLSEKYNKKDLIYYYILVLVTITSLVVSIFTVKQYLYMSVFLSIIYFVGIIICLGVYSLSAYKGYNNRKSVFSNVIREIQDIFIVAMKQIGGCIILAIILSFIFILPLMIIAFVIASIYTRSNIPPALYWGFTLLYFSVYAFLQLLLIASMLRYFRKLEFGDLINLIDTFKFIKKAIKPFCVYLLKVFAIFLVIIAIPVSILLLLKYFVNVSVPLSFKALKIILFIIYFILSPFYIDLSVQFLKEADKYALDEIKNKPEEEIDEYIEDV